jgi:hypothetical protein
VSYEDPKIRCDGGTITIRQYYFPFANAKRIALADIDHVETYEMGNLTGKYRIWGSGDLRHWFNNDGRRPGKTGAFILHLRDSWFRPVVTPDRPDEFRRELEQAGIRLEAAKV